MSSTDFSLDPKQDLNNILGYVASNTLTMISIALILNVAFVQTYWTKRWGPKWMLPLVIGEYTYALGFGLRFALHYFPDLKLLYIVEDFFVVLSPCAFIAADYVLLGRLARYLDCTSYLIVPAKRITVIFVISDISTFLIQAAGGGLSTAKSISTALAGQHVFQAGLALQLASFAIFSTIYACFLYRIYKYECKVWVKDASKSWRSDWRALAGALCISCIGILIRSVYRVIEVSGGYRSYLATSEAYFYAFDTLPLFIAISVYIPFWPGWFIQSTELPIQNSQTTTLDKEP
ncbi:RTA1-like protein [Melanogaster broomeanus]|nr:RTA1-like protein [Melanogaster broomeanus]